MPAHAVGTLDARAEPTWPRPGLFVDRSYVPCAGQRNCAGISGASRLGPNVAAVAAGFKEVSYYHRRDALRA